MSMVIGVPLKVEEDEIRRDVIAVPRVTRLSALVPSVRHLLAQQSVMLDIVRAGELPPAEGDLNGQEHQQRSEEHTSELQSLMRISYAVFCLQKKNQTNKPYYYNNEYHTK